jgi:hypothetical protein
MLQGHFLKSYRRKKIRVNESFAFLTLTVNNYFTFFLAHDSHKIRSGFLIFYSFLLLFQKFLLTIFVHSQQ